MRLRFIPLLLLSLIVFELYVLFLASESIGSLKVLALIIMTAVLGISYIKKQGIKTITKARERISSGKSPNSEFIQGLLLAFGGVFLLIPGFISDLIGLVFALPFTRKQIAKYILGSFQSFLDVYFRLKRRGMMSPREILSMANFGSTEIKKNLKKIPKTLENVNVNHHISN